MSLGTQSSKHSDLIQGKIEKIKLAISKIKSSDPELQHSNQKPRSELESFTPQTTSIIRKTDSTRYDQIFLNNDSEDNNENEVAKSDEDFFPSKTQNLKRYYSRQNMEPVTSQPPFTPSKSVEDDLHRVLQKQFKKYAKLKKQYKQCKSDLHTALADLQQTFTDQQKSVRDNSSLTKQVKHLTDENNHLKRQLQQSTNLKLDEVIEQAARDKCRAENLEIELINYRTSLKLQQKTITELKTQLEIERSLHQCQKSFIATVLQLCKVDSCTQAIDILVDNSLKHSFFTNTQILVGAKHNDSVKDTFNRLKLILKQNNTNFYQQVLRQVFGNEHIYKQTQKLLLKEIAQLQKEARVLRYVSQSGMLGCRLQTNDDDVYQSCVDNLRMQIQKVAQKRSRSSDCYKDCSTSFSTE